jgi:hypothetical protein
MSGAGRGFRRSPPIVPHLQKRVARAAVLPAGEDSH